MEKKTLMFLWPASERDRAYLGERLSEWYDLVMPPAFDEETLAAHVGRADVAIGPRISRPVVEAAGRLKLLQVPASGVNGLDMAALAETDITVCNSHSHAPFVAEHAVGMLLSLMKKVALHDRLMREGTWFRPSGAAADTHYLSDTLIGATVGVIGYGHIGRGIVKLLSGFGTDFLVNTRHPDAYADDAPDGVTFADLATVLAKSDAVFVAVALTPDTEGMIGEAEIKAMKPSGYLVNIARAGVVDADAMLAALQNNWIRGGAKDVWAADGDSADVFKDMANALLSPHRAGTHRDFSPAMLDVVANFTAFATGGTLVNRIDVRAGY